MYTDEPIDQAIIEEMLENANWAPTHKKTEPWRFKVIRGAALARLAEFLSSTYKRVTPPEQFQEKKYKKLGSIPLRADSVIAICMQRDPQESLPEWEELAAVAMAVQNMWLTATAHGLGGYWSSPGVLTKHFGEFMELAEGERCLGAFYLAHHRAPDIPRERKPIAEKVSWVTE
jgi:nitroreductase